MVLEIVFVLSMLEWLPEPIFVILAHFRGPFGRPFSLVFWRVVSEGFRARFLMDFRMIFEGIFKDLFNNWRCTLHIAKPRFDTVFIMFAAHRRFQKSLEK